MTPLLGPREAGAPAGWITVTFCCTSGATESCFFLFLSSFSLSFVFFSFFFSSRAGDDGSTLRRLFSASRSSSATSSAPTSTSSTSARLFIPDAATLADEWQHWSLTAPFPQLLAAILAAYSAVALCFAAALALFAATTTSSSSSPSSSSSSSSSSAAAAAAAADPSSRRLFLDSSGAPLPGGARSPTSPEALLWFSITNLVTCGYGSLLPVSRATLAISTLEQLSGVLLASLALGALVARAQLPRARLLFSRVVLLTARDGEPHLVFRVCSTRGGFAAAHEIRARLVSRAPPTAEGETLWSEKELVLSSPPSELKPLETLAHRIGSKSPLHGVRRADLNARPCFVAVTISAVDADTRAPLFARHVYRLPRVVVWGARFAEVLRVVEEAVAWGGASRRRSLVVDLSRFHETVPLAGATATTAAREETIGSPGSAPASAPAAAAAAVAASSLTPLSARKRSAAALPSDRVRSGIERRTAAAAVEKPRPTSSSSSSASKEKEWPCAEFGGAAAVLQQQSCGGGCNRCGGQDKEGGRKGHLSPPAKGAGNDDDRKLLSPLDEKDAEACSRRALVSLPSLVPPPPQPPPPPPQKSKDDDASAFAAAAALHEKLSRVSRAVHEESAALGFVEATPSRLASMGAREAVAAAVAAAAATPAGIAAAAATTGEEEAKRRRRPRVALPPSAFGVAAADAAASDVSLASAAAAPAAAPAAAAPRPRSAAASLPISPFSSPFASASNLRLTAFTPAPAAASLSPRAFAAQREQLAGLLSSAPSSTGAVYGGSERGGDGVGSPQRQQRPEAAAAALPSPFASAATAKKGEQSRDSSAAAAAAGSSSSSLSPRHGYPAPPMSPFASCEIQGEEGGGGGEGGGGLLVPTVGGGSLLGARRETAVPKSAAAAATAAATAVASDAAAADVVEAAARLSSPCSSGGP